MGLKVIITGATGMVGKGVLIECIENPEIEHILIVNRRPSGIIHHKVEELILPDFFDIDVHKETLSGYEACYFCAGVSAVGLPKEEYKYQTYNMTLLFAKTVLAANKKIIFTYVSGMGTDSTEKGKTFWARVKGKTENDLLDLPFKHAYMFRPGFIQPLEGIKTKTKLYSVIYLLLKPLYPVLKLFPKFFTTSEILGRSMLYVTLHGYEKNILESRDINITGKEL